MGIPESQARQQPLKPPRTGLRELCVTATCLARSARSKDQGGLGTSSPTARSLRWPTAMTDGIPDAAPWPTTHGRVRYAAARTKPSGSRAHTRAVGSSALAPCLPSSEWVSDCAEGLDRRGVSCYCIAIRVCVRASVCVPQRSVGRSPRRRLAAINSAVCLTFHSPTCQSTTRREHTVVLRNTYTTPAKRKSPSLVTDCVWKHGSGATFAMARPYDIGTHMADGSG